MANPFFNLGSAAPNLMQMVNQIKQNPMQFLMQRKFNVPKNLMSDPQAMVQHLVSTGQIPQQQINAYYQTVFGSGKK